MSNDHIPTAEVEQDILDTEREIVGLERKLKGYRYLTDDRMMSFRAQACENGIRERKEFIKKLQKILEGRGVTK